jgi:dipeptidyl aminopeptidase/acylaminoacyl peptidase
MRTIAPERVTFNGADDLALEGWVMKPADFDPAKKHPLLLYIHGGPHAAYGHNFMHEFPGAGGGGPGGLVRQSAGRNRLWPGVSGAGAAGFRRQRLPDLLRATDLAASWDWVDSGKRGVLGGSYGGFMTNWIISHTDRFAAANTQRCISN